MFGKKLKTVLMLSLAVTAFGAFAGVPAQASYTLNPEVKDATPALKQAAEIGVRTYNNPAMQDAANKDAIVVMSFGTTFKASRKATIDKTVSDIQAAHPDTKVVLAFTSHIIVDRIKANEGLEIPTPEKPWQTSKPRGIPGSPDVSRRHPRHGVRLRYGYLRHVQKGFQKNDYGYVSPLLDGTGKSARRYQ